MPSRIGAAELPRVRLVDMRQQPRKAVFSPPLIAAITERVQRGEQSLVLLNRRGFAPVLHCADCNWKSDCPHCSAHQVFHKGDRTLRCHHCGFTQRVPHACPGCGNPDILPLGKGTEQLEEELERLLRNVQRPDGNPARVARIDADTTRPRARWSSSWPRCMRRVDVLVGTQMVAKGHDFRRITLVAAVQPDSALFSSDFRAPERLFCLLMQAAGRAGRDARMCRPGQPSRDVGADPRPAARRVHRAAPARLPGFASASCASARMPACRPCLPGPGARRCPHPGSRPGLSARRQPGGTPGQAALSGRGVLYPPIPMAVQRVANVERAQMLLEAGNRRAAALSACLAAVLHWLRTCPSTGLVRWLVDVDPLSI
jgi:primosomal protein N' (replication factor Y)